MTEPLSPEGAGRKRGQNDFSDDVILCPTKRQGANGDIPVLRRARIVAPAADQWRDVVWWPSIAEGDWRSPSKLPSRRTVERPRR